MLLLSGLAAARPITLRVCAERTGRSSELIVDDARHGAADDGHASVDRMDQRSQPASPLSSSTASARSPSECSPATLAVRAGTPIATTNRASATPELGERVRPDPTPKSTRPPVLARRRVPSRRRQERTGCERWRRRGTARSFCVCTKPTRRRFDRPSEGVARCMVTTPPTSARPWG